MGLAAEFLLLVGGLWFSGPEESAMSRPEAEHEKRPERVIILDADDPMTEVYGRVVWQEEHDRVVEGARRLAFAEGYSVGHRDAASVSSTPTHVEFRRHRRPARSRIKLAILILATICLLLTLPALVFAS